MDGLKFNLQFKKKLNIFRAFLNGKPFLFFIVLFVFHDLLFFFINELFLIKLWHPLSDVMKNHFGFTWWSVVNRWFLVIILKVVLTYFIVVFFGYGYIYKKRLGVFKTLKLHIFFVVYVLIFFLINFYNSFFVEGLHFKSFEGLMFGAVYNFKIGFTEDTLFIGLILNCFFNRYGSTKKGVWFSLICSGVLFGLIHFANLDFENTSLWRVWYQFFTAIFYALCSGAVYLRGGCLWVLFFLHGLNDAAFTPSDFFVKEKDDFLTWLTFTPDIEDIIFGLVFSTMLFLVTIFLLRKSKIIEVINRRNINFQLKD